MTTIECSCRLCPTPGMYAVTSIAFVSRTRATFRSAEFGFFGVVVYTRMHTPRFCGEPVMAGALDFFRIASRPYRTSWLIVGIEFLPLRDVAGFPGDGAAEHSRHQGQNSSFIATIARPVNHRSRP